MRAFARVLILALVLAAAARPLEAAPIILTPLDGTGSFDFADLITNDNDIVFLSFTVGAGTLFSAQTTSFQNSNGFDPYLALLGPDGRMFNYFSATEGDFVPARSEDIDGVNFDASLNFTLTAEGTYTLLLGQYSNYITEDGVFTYDDSPFYTSTEFGGGEGCSAFFSPFVEEGGCRTGAYAFNVTLTSPDTASVPEPGTLTLLGLGVAGAALRKTRRRSRP